MRKKLKIIFLTIELKAKGESKNMKEKLKNFFKKIDNFIHKILDFLKHI